MPLTCEQLDEFPCPNCKKKAGECGVVVRPIQGCHPNTGLRVEYKEGVMTMLCLTCDELAFQILVARTDDA